MPACVVVGCTNRPDRERKTGITFHRFPKSEAMKQEWVKAIRRENFTPSKHSNVCSAHFREEDMDRTSLCCIRLREGVVPSVFDSFPSHSQTSHEKEIRVPTKRKNQCVTLPAKFEAKKGEAKKPFPVKLFVNEAFLRSKAVESSVTEVKREQDDYPSGDVRFQYSDIEIKTEKCVLENSVSRYSNEDTVDSPNENSEVDHKSINDSNQIIKCETELQEVDSDSFVSNDAMNMKIKVESNEEDSDDSCYLLPVHFVPGST